MRAVHVTSLDGPSSLQVVDVGEPVPGPGQVLVDVHAAGVAFPDLLLSRGEYQLKPPPPFVPGSEIAGTVVSAPEGSGFAVGDRVAGFCMLGGFAERVVCPVDGLYRLPDAVTFAQGAALPMNYLTVEFALLRRGRLTAPDTVLVHGAAGGIGTAALQLIRWRGARSIAVVSQPDKMETARAAGADDVVLASGFLEQVKELTGGRGVDIVVDPVGGDRFTDSLRSLATEGRLLVIGFAAGEIPTVRVNRLLLNNIDVVGVAWGAYALAQPGYLAQQWATLAPGIESGALRPPIGARYPLEGAGQALDDVDHRRAAGKIVLEIRG